MSNFKKINEDIWLRYIFWRIEFTGNKENFFAEKSNIFLGRPLHSVGYVKLNIQSGRRHQKY